MTDNVGQAEFGRTRRPRQEYTGGGQEEGAPRLLPSQPQKNFLFKFASLMNHQGIQRFENHKSLRNQIWRHIAYNKLISLFLRH